MSSKFTEQETESYYDSEDAIYRSIGTKTAVSIGAYSTIAPETISSRRAPI